MRWIISGIVLIAVAGAAYIRLAPTEADRWHVDPETAGDPGQGGVLRRHPVAAAPAAALAAFDAVAREAPRTRVLAGGLEEGRITYETRTPIMGFPDYVTVTAVPADGGAALVILSRLRFGQGDMGTNGKRLDAWLARLDARGAE